MCGPFFEVHEGSWSILTHSHVSLSHGLVAKQPIWRTQVNWATTTRKIEKMRHGWLVHRTISNWWSQPSWKMWVKLDHHPNYWGKKKMFQTTNQIFTDTPICSDPIISWKFSRQSSRSSHLMNQPDWTRILFQLSISLGWILLSSIINQGVSINFDNSYIYLYIYIYIYI